MRAITFSLGLASVLGVLALSVGCSDTSSSSPGGGGSGAFGGTGGTGGTGAVGGTGATGGAAGSGATGGTGATGGAAGSGGSVGDAGTPADHVLLSEVGLEPGAAEFVEVWNPTNAEVDLSDYYIADNSAYHALTSGPWNPQGTPGTDFLVRFPAGTKLAADAVLVVASENAAGSPTFETTFGKCPDFIMSSTATPLSCGGGSVPAMLIPTNGSVGTSAGAMISNDREMIVLFTWDGSSSTVQDVDYVTWGTNFDDNTRIDKTGVSGYQADTPRASQKSADPGVAADGGAPLGIERCKLEPGEKLSGGNGLTGHDETSEDMGTGWSGQASLTPGAKNGCL